MCYIYLHLEFSPHRPLSNVLQTNAAAPSDVAMSATDSTENGSYTMVWYADWDNQLCALTGLDGLKSWEKQYPTEDECCLENFHWDVKGRCFQTLQPATESPTSTFSPSSSSPTVQPPTTQPTLTVMVFIRFDEKCIQVNKSTLKKNAKSYDTEDKCHLDNNLGDYQPTVAPSFSPTVTPTESPTMAPSFSPTISPTELETMKPTRAPSTPPSQSNAGAGICTIDFCEYEISADYKLEYLVNVPDNTSVDECNGCSLSVRLTYDGETSWIGMGLSTTGEMIGSEAIM